MSELIHYLSVAIVIILPTLGVGIGQGLANRLALKMIDEQPSAEGALKRLAIISLTLSETAIILAVITGFLMIFDKNIAATYSGLGYLGVICAVAIPGFLVGLMSYFPAKEALIATSRQPFIASKILQLLLITQTIIQTPIIFGFIVALLIKGQIPNATTLSEGLRLFSSGLVIALGSIGPVIGLGRLTRDVMEVTGINREIYPKLRVFAFVSQALIEAQVIFALLIGIVLAIYKSSGNELVNSAIFLSAALGMGLTTISAGLNSGKVASKAAKLIGQVPQSYSALSRSCMITQTLIDTAVIYAALVALIILFVRT